MKYTPYEKLSYLSELNRVEIITKLKKVTETRKIRRFGSSKPHEFFEGKIDNSNFKFQINKIITTHKNSFNPIILGSIKKKNNGSEIIVEIRPFNFVIILISISLGIALFFLVVVIKNSIENQKLNELIVFPFFIIGFLYLITIFGYNSENEKIKNYLNELFESKNNK